MFGAIQVVADYFNDLTLLLFIIAAVLLTTLLAGFYPAFISPGLIPQLFFGAPLSLAAQICFQDHAGFSIAIAIMTVIAGFGCPKF
jgi:hypothetical protein